MVYHVLQAYGAVSDMKNQIAAIKRVTVEFARRNVNYVLVAVVGNKVVAAAVLINLHITVAR